MSASLPNFAIFTACVFVSGFTCCLATTLLLSCLASRKEKREAERLDNTKRDEKAFSE